MIRVNSSIFLQEKNVMIDESLSRILNQLTY